MAKIEIGRYSDRLRRMLGMKGASDVATELSPEVSPVIVLEQAGAEWEFLQGVRLCGVSTLLLGVAANRSILRLRNPLRSGVIATVTQTEYVSTALPDVNLQRGREQVDLATIGATAVRDTRWGPQSALFRTALQASSTNGGAVPAGEDVLWRIRTLANTRNIYSSHYVLIPGDSVDLSTVTVNTPIIGTFTWKERPVAPLEL